MKQLFTGLWLCCALMAAKAQTFTPPAYAEVPTAKRYAWNHDYRNYVNQVFSALEANRVSTGLLLDYGFDFADAAILRHRTGRQYPAGARQKIFLHPHCYINYNV
jgi:hypothetical protein